MLALRLGRKLHWDPQAENFLGDKEASKFINAILDAVMKQQKGEKIDSSEIKEAFKELEETSQGPDGGI